MFGVYKITNLINGKIYIGSSTNIYKRLNKHKNLLRENKHFSDHLQSAWKARKAGSNLGLTLSEEAKVEISTRQFKKTLQYDLDGNFVKEYLSILEAGNTLGINIHTISECANFKKGRYKAGGFQWRFKINNEIPDKIEKCKTKKLNFKAVKVCKNGECLIFKSMTECSKFLGRTISAIRVAIKKSKKIKGYIINFNECK